MWNLLGPRKVQLMAFENFGDLWADDAVKHLKLDAEVLKAPYGRLPDLGKIDPEADLVFPWNGTTSGVRVPDGDFLKGHKGLVLCDATSAAFCMELPWADLDVVTFSFQKALGGEAGIGVLILSPRAVERLDTWDSGRAIPKVLRLKKGARADEKTLGGDAINTFSFMVIEDYLDALKWATFEGGLSGLIRRCEANFNALAEWVEATSWVDFVAEVPAQRSTTSVCLKFVDPAVTAQPSHRHAGKREPRDPVGCERHAETGCDRRHHRGFLGGLDDDVRYGADAFEIGHHQVVGVRPDPLRGHDEGLADEVVHGQVLARGERVVLAQHHDRALDAQDLDRTREAQDVRGAAERFDDDLLVGGGVDVGVSGDRLRRLRHLRRLRTRADDRRNAFARALLLVVADHVDVRGRDHEADVPRALGDLLRRHRGRLREHERRLAARRRRVDFVFGHAPVLPDHPRRLSAVSSRGSRNSGSRSSVQMTRSALVVSASFVMPRRSNA